VRYHIISREETTEKGKDESEEAEFYRRKPSLNKRAIHDKEEAKEKPLASRLPTYKHNTKRGVS
jgi:hypothetical protein